MGKSLRNAVSIKWNAFATNSSICQSLCTKDDKNEDEKEDKMSPEHVPWQT